MDWAIILSTAGALLAGLLTVFATRRAARRELYKNKKAVDLLAESRASEHAAAVAGAMEAMDEAMAATKNGSRPSVEHGTGTRVEDEGPPRVVREAIRGSLQRLVEALAKRSEERFKIQKEHYNNALRQSTIYFYLSIAVGTLGFILMVTGAALAMAKLVEVAVLTGIGALLAEAAAALIFTQSNRAKSDAQANLTAIGQAAERDENRQMVLIYSWQVKDPALRDSMNAELARQYLALLGAS